MALISRISKESRVSRNKNNLNHRRLSSAGGLSYQEFEPRLLLAATPELTAFHDDVISNYIASTPETAYLLSGENDLRFIAADTEARSTTSLFQQTFNGIAIQDAYVTVVQQGGAIPEVYDRGFEQLLTDDGINPLVSVVDAEMIASHKLGDQHSAISSELVWYHLEDRAELTWQVSTFLNESTDEFPTADFIFYVDADSGVVLRQETPFELVEYLLEQPDIEVGEFGRIVINNAIGASGSRAYAAPFDAVVELSSGCTGTLIASNTILTARHCGAGAGTQIVFGDNGNNPDFVATVQSSFLPGGGNSNSPFLNGGDVAILTLSSNVPTSVATPIRLIGETSSLVGQVAATVGYGYNGLGSSGHGFSADGFRWGGENIIDVYGSPAGSSGSNIFSTDFDNGSNGNNTISGSSATPLQFEATTAPGDSGGPILVLVDSEWVVAGVLSGGTTSTSVYGDISWWTGIANYQADIEARGGIFIGSGTGSVALNASVYTVGSVIAITVNDGNAPATVPVTITSSNGDSETVTLTGNAGVYTGTIASVSGTPSANDGQLQAALGDTFIVTYQDTDDGNGNPLTVTDNAAFANVTQYVSVDTPINITDNNTFVSTITIADSGALLDIELQLDITHTWDGDLTAVLTAPNGTQITLFNRIGSSGNDYDNTLFDDDASQLISAGSPPYTGTFRPTESFPALNGIEVNGNWTLSITDAATQDTGTLNGWSLFITVSNPVIGPISDANPANNQVTENASVGATVGITASAPDPGDTVTYTLTDNAGGRFAIHSSTGVVTVAGPLDFESATNHSIDVHALSSDGSSSDETFSIAITNINDAVISTRQIFYENSSFDGSNDFDAVAPNKQFLVDGQTATFANYSSYWLGLNGLVLEVNDLNGTPNLANFGDYFDFNVGNDDKTGEWADAPDPIGVTFQSNVDANGTDRVFLTWNDNAIENEWLQITILAGATTGLATPDVFYFGSVIGETGNDPANAKVNPADIAGTRLNQSGFETADILNPYDFDRSGKVNPTDIAIARLNQSGFSFVNLITPGTVSKNSGLGNGVIDPNQSNLGFDPILARDLDSKTDSPRKQRQTRFELGVSKTLSLAGSQPAGDRPATDSDTTDGVGIRLNEKAKFESFLDNAFEKFDLKAK